MIGNYEVTFVEGMYPQSVSGAVDGNYVSMKGYDHCTIVINCGVNAGASSITVNKATDVSASDEAAYAFDYMWTNDGAPTLSALTKTDVTSNTFDVDVAYAMYVIEIPAASLKAGSATEFDCIQVAFAAASATTLCSATYVLWKGRYKSDTPIEPLTD